MLGNEKQAEEQAKYAEDTLKQARNFAKQHHKTAYLARNADGLQTGQKVRFIRKQWNWLAWKTSQRENKKA